MITRDEFEEIAKLCCPLCAAGSTPEQRQDTMEWQHRTTEKVEAAGTKSYDWVKITFCQGTPFRNSRFSEVLKEG